VAWLPRIDVRRTDYHGGHLWKRLRRWNALDDDDDNGGGDGTGWSVISMLHDITCNSSSSSSSSSTAVHAVYYVRPQEALWNDGRCPSVCLSVRLSVCRVPRPNSRTERPRKPQYPWTYFEVKRSKVKVTGSQSVKALLHAIYSLCGGRILEQLYCCAEPPCCNCSVLLGLFLVYKLETYVWM